MRGDIIPEFEYLPFGTVTMGVLARLRRLRQCPEMGLVHMQARYCNPITARFRRYVYVPRLANRSCDRDGQDSNDAFKSSSTAELLTFYRDDLDFDIRQFRYLRC
jgi:hypothetical protein